MTTYILFWAIVVGKVQPNITSGTQEFKTKKACLSASLNLQITVKKLDYATTTVTQCDPKNK